LQGKRGWEGVWGRNAPKIGRSNNPIKKNHHHKREKKADFRGGKECSSARYTSRNVDTMIAPRKVKFMTKWESGLPQGRKQKRVARKGGHN